MRSFSFFVLQFPKQQKKTRLVVPNLGILNLFSNSYFKIVSFLYDKAVQVNSVISKLKFLETQVFLITQNHKTVGTAEI